MKKKEHFMEQKPLIVLRSAPEGALVTFQINCRAYIEPKYVDQFLDIKLAANKIRYILGDELAEVWDLIDEAEILSIEYA